MGGMFINGMSSRRCLASPVIINIMAGTLRSPAARGKREEREE